MLEASEVNKTDIGTVRQFAGYITLTSACEPRPICRKLTHKDCKVSMNETELGVIFEDIMGALILWNNLSTYIKSARFLF